MLQKIRWARSHVSFFAPSVRCFAPAAPTKNCSDSSASPRSWKLSQHLKANPKNMQCVAILIAGYHSHVAVNCQPNAFSERFSIWKFFVLLTCAMLHHRVLINAKILASLREHSSACYLSQEGTVRRGVPLKLHLDKTDSISAE
jgi:hypothetical protein